MIFLKWTLLGYLLKKHSYSKPSQTTTSDKDYKHSQTVCEKLECKTFRDYHMSYLNKNVLLLADVFENVRDMCLGRYEQDPPYYDTLPNFAWDAMLKKQK